VIWVQNNTKGCASSNKTCARIYMSKAESFVIKATTDWPSDVIHLNLVEGHLSEGLGDKLNHVVVVDNFVDVAFVIGA
jgi:hypothetical protein